MLGDLEAGEPVTVIGRSPSDSWLYIRDNAGVEGFVWRPFFNWSGDFQALPTRVAPDGWVASGESAFILEYLGCQPHDFTLGSVKGQVFDQAGQVIVGARVEIWINGSRWDDPANPATTNEDGWYEWIISLDQNIQLAALYIDGRRVSFSPRDLVMTTRPACFQHVNFRQR